MCNRLRVDFLQAINRVGIMVSGNERFEAGLWVLLRLIRATELEKAVFANNIMSQKKADE